MRWEKMNELEGVEREDVAFREWEQKEWEKEAERREWEKKEVGCQEGSRSTGEVFISNPDTVTIGRTEQLPGIIVDRSSPQRGNGSRAVSDTHLTLPTKRIV